MDIFFQDPDDAPVPPEEVRIREFSASPYPDGRRVRIQLEVTPFLKRPSGEILLKNADGIVIASANIIETMTRKMELTLHLRSEVEGEILAAADIFYQEVPTEEPNGGSEGEFQLSERERVDYSEIVFTIPA